MIPLFLCHPFPFNWLLVWLCYTYLLLLGVQHAFGPRPNFPYQFLRSSSPLSFSFCFIVLINPPSLFTSVPSIVQESIYIPKRYWVLLPSQFSSTYPLHLLSSACYPGIWVISLSALQRTQDVSSEPRSGSPEELQSLEKKSASISLKLISKHIPLNKTGERGELIGVIFSKDYDFIVLEPGFVHHKTPPVMCLSFRFTFQSLLNTVGTPELSSETLIF